MNRNPTVEEMVAYMNEKYDDHFEYAAPFGGGPGAVSKQIIVTSEKFPEAQIWVQRDEKDGKEVFTDNYVSYKYEEQTRAFLRELLENAFHGKAAIFYGVGTRGTGGEFADDTTFEAYISNIFSDIGFQACVLIEDSGADIRSFEDDLKKEIQSSGLIAFGTVYFTTDPGRFREVSELSEKEFDLFDFDLFDQLYFDMNGPNSFRYFEWRMGNDR